MRTFGRVLAGLGLALAGIGGIGAIALLPPPVLDSAISRAEEWRQAVRAHLPEIPALGDLITGASEDACAEPEAGVIPSAGEPGSGDGFAEAADCADDEPEVGVLRGGNGPATRSAGGGTRFLAPAPAGPAAD